jgi:protocatechuate 3,4-dioxygenase beta subunit
MSAPAAPLKAIAVLLVFAASAHAQVRDPARPAPRDNAPAAAGTASIVGTIVTDTEAGRPVRRVIVDIDPTDGGTGKTLITDDNGRFAATRLRAGSYRVNASKRGWAGAKGFPRPGRVIELADGQRQTMSITLLRGAVISGVVLDESGQRPASVSLRVMRYTSVNGGRRLDRAPSTTYGPDERGEYRIYGLAAGEYYIVAASNSVGPFRGGSDLHLTSDVDVQEAVAAIHAGPASPIAEVPQRNVAVAPVYYPGSFNVAQATPVTLRAGEERSGVDFVVRYVPSVHVEGMVTGLDNEPSTNSMVALVNADPNVASLGIEALRTARTDDKGHFSFTEVTPGSYVLSAHGAPVAGWAISELDVQGQDLHDLSLVMQPALSVSGSVKFEGSAALPALTNVRVNLAPQATPAGITISSATNVNLEADGRFTLKGVSPGRYRLSAFIPPRDAWVVRSSSLGGQDALDTYVDVRQTLTDASIVFTDQLTTLSGHARPASTVLLFSTNQAQWYQGSRRVVTARATADGSYTVRTVPAGQYFCADIDEPEPGQTSDPSFLQSLAATAAKIGLVEGEKKTLDLRPGG